MAKNDYHVVVYQILSYLYVCLKDGRKVEGVRISERSDFYAINKKYWDYVIRNIVDGGLVTGIVISPVDGGHLISGLDDAEITPEGIDYLTENSFLKKAARFAKEFKDLVPFVL